MNRNYFALLIALTGSSLACAMQPSDVGYASRMHRTNNEVILFNNTDENIITTFITTTAKGEDRAPIYLKEATIGLPRTGRVIVRPLKPHGILHIQNMNPDRGEKLEVNSVGVFPYVPGKLSQIIHGLDNNRCVTVVSKRWAPTASNWLNFGLVFSEPVCKSLTESEADIEKVIEQLKEGQILPSSDDQRRARQILAAPTTPPWEILEIAQNSPRTEIGEALLRLTDKWYAFKPTTEDERTLKIAFIQRLISAAAEMNPTEVAKG